MRRKVYRISLIVALVLFLTLFVFYIWEHQKLKVPEDGYFVNVEVTGDRI